MFVSPRDARSKMIRILLAVTIIIAALAIKQRPAQAAEAPWCIIVEGGERCYYNSIEQCAREASAGSRGLCHQNPRYHGPQPSHDAPQRRGKR